MKGEKEMEGSTTTIAQTLSTALQGVADSAIEGIGVVLPVALTVMGAMLVITIGVKLFKRFSK